MSVENGAAEAGVGDASSLPHPFVIRNVAVIGAGSAGREFALACARAGFAVVLEDVMPEKLRRAESDFADLNLPPNSPGSLRVALTVEDAVHSADVAIDFVPDELESKLEIFSLLDRMAPPRTILLTPTIALSITDLASCTYRPDRCLALYGIPTAVGPLRILHPRAVSKDAAAAVVSFLERTGSAVTCEEDPVTSMLVK